MQEPAGIGSTRRFVAAAADLGTCPLHSHERYKLLYEKLVETAKAQAAVVTPEEESDMEASDVEDEVPNVNSDSLPLGTTFRTIHVLQNQPQIQEPKPTFVPRKLSTISSQDRESIPNIDEEEAEELEDTLPDDDHRSEVAQSGCEPEVEENKTTEAEVHAKLLNQTDFEWHPDSDEDDHGTLPSVDANLASEASCNDPESEALLSQEPKSEIDTSKLPQTTAVKPARIGSRYKNTHV